MQRIRELIDSTAVEPDISKKVENLYVIKELAFCHGVQNFVDDILAFQSERHANVKKFVVDFIEACIKQDCSLCPKVVLSLNLLLAYSNTEVIKRSIQASSQFYVSLIKWITSTLDQASNIEQTWLIWLQIKQTICNLFVTANNDGIRTNCVKFMETVVMMQTPRDKYTETGRELNLIDQQMSAQAVVVDLFNDNHKLLLLDEAKKLFEQLISFQGTMHISSVNLMAAMQSLAALARQRSQLFMGSVVQALEALQRNLPPTLTESQVKSVKKFLKLQSSIIGKSTTNQKRIKLENRTNVKQLDLNRLTQEMNEEEKQRMVVESVKRILSEEKRVFIAPAQLEVKKKVLSALANEFHDTTCPKIIQEYIFQDLRNRHEISYSIIKKNFDIAASRAAKRQLNLFDHPELLSKYLVTFHSYINEAMNWKDIKERDFILPRLYSESPYITNEAIRLLESFITEHQNYPLATQCGLKILINLIEYRADMRQKLLLLLVELAKFDQSDIKEDVEKYAKELYESQKDNEMIKLFLEEELLSSAG